MHEFSIVQALLMQIEENAIYHKAKAVSKVHIIIGEVSGAEPSLLKTAFDTFKQNTIAQNSELIIEFQKPIIRCFSCGKSFELNKFRMRCPECESFNVKVEKGDELILKTLELEL